MRKIFSPIQTFLADEGGITAIEYGLIAALVALALIAGATVLGTKLNDSFTFISGLMKTS